MKIEKSNNPVAVGALLLVLTIIVGRILWMVIGRGSSLSAASPLVVRSVSPAADAPRAENLTPRRLTVRTGRNPFASLAGRASETASPGRAAALVSPRTAPESVIAPLPTIPIPAGPTLQIPVRSSRRPPLSAGARIRRVPHQTVIMQDQSQEILKTLKLTAILGGTEPMAVIQTARPEPLTVHVGDSVEGLQVAAINDHNIVLSHQGELWTLALESGADAAPASVSAVPQAAPQENIHESL